MFSGPSTQPSRHFLTKVTKRSDTEFRSGTPKKRPLLGVLAQKLEKNRSNKSEKKPSFLEERYKSMILTKSSRRLGFRPPVGVPVRSSGAFCGNLLKNPKVGPEGPSKTGPF